MEKYLKNKSVDSFCKYTFTSEGCQFTNMW